MGDKKLDEAMLRKRFYTYVEKFVKEFTVILNGSFQSKINFRKISDWEYSIELDRGTIKIQAMIIIENIYYSIRLTFIESIGENKIKVYYKGIILSKTHQYGDKEIHRAEKEAIIFINNIINENSIQGKLERAA